MTVLSLVGFAAIVALIPVAIVALVVLATRAEQRAATLQPVFPRYVSAAAYGASGLLAFVVLGWLPGFSLSTGYAAPFLAWTIPLVIIWPATIALAFHRVTNTYGMLGAATAGIAVTWLSTLLAASTIAVVVGPAPWEALGMAFFIAFMLVKSGWLLFASGIGVCTGVILNYLARQRSLRRTACPR